MRLDRFFSIRDIVSAAAGHLIALGLAAVGGVALLFIKSIRTWLWERLVDFWGLLASRIEIHVPVWAAVGAGLYVAIMTGWCMLRLRPPESGSTSARALAGPASADISVLATPRAQPQPAVTAGLAVELSQLSDLEVSILRTFGQQHLDEVERNSLAGFLNVHEFLVEEALSSLVSRALLRKAFNIIYGTSYVLTTQGRQFIIQQGIV
jgi:hypothetical protein